MESQAFVVYLNFRYNLRMLSFILVTVAFVLVDPQLAEGSANCSAEDTLYAESLGGHYVPEEAYAFGNLIRQQVEKRDVEGLLSLFRGELAYGPLREFSSSRPFHSTFSQVWIDSVRKSSPPCYPEGRHFMLGDRGEVWFNKVNGEWTIVSINLASKAAYRDRRRQMEKVHGGSEGSIEFGWKVGETILPPQCFSHQWVSAENFEEIAEEFDVSQYNIFNFPGELFGREIHSFQPFVPKWCGWAEGYCHQKNETWSGKGKLSLHQPLNTCITEETAITEPTENTRGAIYNKIGVREYKYSLLRENALAACDDLAPAISSICTASYIVEIAERTNKSEYWDYDYGVYGLFDLLEVGPSVVPLKFFPRMTDAIKFWQINYNSLE